MPAHSAVTPARSIRRERVAQQQGEERAEHVAADGGVGPVEDGARVEQLRPRCRVLGGLLLIVAEDVAARPLPVPAEPDLLDPQLHRVGVPAPGLDGLERTGDAEHGLGHLLGSASAPSARTIRRLAKRAPERRSWSTPPLAASLQGSEGDLADPLHLCLKGDCATSRKTLLNGRFCSASHNHG